MSYPTKRTLQYGGLAAQESAAPVHMFHVLSVAMLFFDFTGISRTLHSPKGAAAQH
jgi:hypothetical protein